MTQNNAERADELLALGRELFGDEWATFAEELAADVQYVEFSTGAWGCVRCGSVVFDQPQHSPYHRLLTLGVHFSSSVTTSHWARCEVGAAKLLEAPEAQGGG